MREIRPGRPASRCRRTKGMTATSARESAPNASEPSTADTFSEIAAPRSLSETFRPLFGKANSSALALLRPMPPGERAAIGRV